MIKPGYKKTELGWIPDEWEEKEFGKVFDFIKSESFSRDNLCYDYNDNCILNIHYGDIHASYKNQILNFDTDDKIPVLKSEFHRKNFEFLKDGDLIIADVSEDYEGIGECVELKNVKNRKVTGGLHTIIVRDSKNITADGFRAYIFKNRFISLKIKQIATGISVYGVSKGNLSKLNIPLPPLPEQKKIAEILSTWDKAIETTEKMIEEKIKLKKGMMQKLLTGKLRFKEFEGEKWKYKKLSELTCLLTNGFVGTATTHYVEDDEGITYIQGYNVSENGFNFRGIKKVSKNFHLKNKKSILQEGDLLTIQTGDVGVTAIVPKSLSGSNCHALVISRFYQDICESRFYHQFFNSTFGRKLLKAIETGSTMKHLNVGDMKDLFIPFPILREQKIIADTLSMFDKDIELLIKYLQAIKEQKKGLMQKLLTGEVRVKVKEDEQ
jgi:type I restriction enzyme S subunit